MDETEGMRKARKKDKRSIATEKAIKASLLEALAKTRFDQVTVSQVSKGAEVTRATFYQHYGNLGDVLDELMDDMVDIMGDVPFAMCEACSGSGLAHAPGAEGARSYEWKGIPFCHFLASGNEYRVLLEDGSIAERLVERLVDDNLDAMMSRLRERYPESAVTPSQLRYFNVFRMSGCLAAAKAAMREGYDWSLVQPTLDAAIASAFSTLR